MKNKYLYFLILFYCSMYSVSSKQQSNNEFCQSCNCTIQELRRQVKELEGMLSVYRKELTDLMQKYANALMSEAERVAKAYSEYAGHLIKCVRS